MRFLVTLAMVCLIASCSSADTSQSGTLSAAGQEELMSRWNSAADTAQTTTDFHWPTFDRFPHPTTKFGTEEAYQEFAEVLLLFFQQDFDFLAQNHLFQLTLRYAPQPRSTTSFQKLASDFSSSATSFANIPAATQQEIKGFLDRM